MTDPGVLRFRQVVLDAVDPRELAEFYRRLLGLRYRAGDEAPEAGEEDTQAQGWLVIEGLAGGVRLAFQCVPELAPVTWPEGPQPQQLHLDLTVRTIEELDEQHRRATELGATILEDRTDDPEEPLWVYADPAGHPFCIFVATDG